MAFGKQNTQIPHFIWLEVRFGKPSKLLQCFPLSAIARIMRALPETFYKVLKLGVGPSTAKYHWQWKYHAFTRLPILIARISEFPFTFDSTVSFAHHKPLFPLPKTGSSPTTTMSFSGYSKSNLFSRRNFFSPIPNRPFPFSLSLSLSLAYGGGILPLTAKCETLGLFSQMLSVLAMILNR